MLFNLVPPCFSHFNLHCVMVSAHEWGSSPIKLKLRMYILHDVHHTVHPVCLGYEASVQSTGPFKILFEVWPLEMHV